jgi:hypothetical protein
MYIYGNNNGCSVNNECESGYSLYFPCVKTLTRGENACFDFYVVDNATKEEVDLRNVDGITLNISGRYNCNFGSFSYPDYIKFLQVEKFSENVYDINFSDILKKVDLYIDIVDENHNLIESFLFDENKLVDIAIEGYIGYFLNGSFLNLKCFDTKHYMFLGWDIDEDYEECDSDNRYNFLINSRNLTYNIVDDITIRVVYQKRREYNIQVASDNINSSFVVEYMGEKNTLHLGDRFTVLEGHDVKLSCIPNDEKPYKFVRWEDGFKEPYRILRVEGDNLLISLKAYCELSDNVETIYEDNIDASTLNIFNIIYPEINDSIFVDSYYIDNLYINSCEIDILNGVPYIKVIDGGYIQVQNISKIGNFKLSLNNIGGNCRVFVGNHEISPSIVDSNEFIFEFESDTITLTGKESCIFGLKIYKEVVYDKGKCMLCLSSEDTLKLHKGELVVDGGVIVNGNPYGLLSVKIANVSNVTPLIIKNNTI